MSHILTRDDLNHIIIESTGTGTSLVSFNVADNDIGINAEYTITLSDAVSLPFEIVDNSNLTVSDTLSPTTYNLVVVATDQGDPPLSSNVTVVVTVEPLNDASPQFSSDVYTFQFNETSAGIGSVFEFTVTDADIGGLDSPGTVDALLLSSTYSDSFNISTTITNDETIVRLTVVNAFDHETISTFNLTVQAFDTGYIEFRRTSEVTVMIEILDVNDNLPEFTQEMFATVLGENATVGYQFYQLTANDNDTVVDAVLNYTLLNYKDVFAVDQASGWLSVNGMIDRKQKDTYELNVRVTDSSGNFDTATVTVTITEVNDFAPQFVDVPKTVTIEENSVNYSLSFTVYDDDSEQPGEFDVHIEHSTNEVYFELQSNYSLVLIKQLDYEV